MSDKGTVSPPTGKDVLVNLTPTDNNQQPANAGALSYTVTDSATGQPSTDAGTLVVAASGLAARLVTSDADFAVDITATSEFGPSDVVHVTRVAGVVTALGMTAQVVDKL